MAYLMGVDLGTQSVKAMIMDEHGEVKGTASESYELSIPKPGYAEQSPGIWHDASAAAIRRAAEASGVSPGAIEAVSFSGQMHGLVMLDKDGKVLRPSIIWCDQRTENEVAQMERVVGREKLIRITANPAMTGFTAAKILWVQNNEPDVYARCAHILLPKDYIRYRLTGEFATEVSDAAGMQLMDIPQRDWSNEILGLLHIDRSLLADMHEAPDVTGRVHARAASETNLPEGTIVVGGAGDNPAAAVGTGVVSEGSAFTTLGSSAVVYAVSDTVKIDLEGRVHALCASAPGKWTVMSCTQGAGISLKWLRDTCCLPEVLESEKQGVDPYVIMDKLASEIPAGSDRLIFLPYMMGERSPHPDPDCRGVFFGLSAMH